MSKNNRTLTLFKHVIPYIVLILVVCILLTSCSSGEITGARETTAAQQGIGLTSAANAAGIDPADKEGMGADSNDIVIKGLVLKYVLVDSAYEIYQTNILKEKPFSFDSYSRMGEDTKNHFIWMEDTYNSLDADNKAHLKDLFESGIHAWKLMDVTTRLDDSAGVDDIVQKLASSREIKGGSKLKAAITDFLPYFYLNYLKAYIEENDDTFNKYIEKLNKQVQEKDADIIGFMERNSGIRFKTKYKPEFYYTLRPIGAMGFQYKDRKVSTLQRTCTDYTYLLSAPFHEFSHELFKTFTDANDFLEVTGPLMNNTEFRNVWNNSIKNNYNWTGWCEENLVEGFAKYLDYKYYSRDDQYSTYFYDLDFCNYLKERKFDGQKESLKEICIEFYKSKLQQ
ncbi:MAG TPA: hypothetical protein VHT96_10000 [Clostridia bacterium]|nr:hypothetical protein [Clostridia bacterium]